MVSYRKALQAMSHIVRSINRFCIRRVVYPSGKPMIPHLPRCQGFGVDYTTASPCDALDLRHPHLLEPLGKRSQSMQDIFISGGIPEIWPLWHQYLQYGSGRQKNLYHPVFLSESSGFRLP
jgi:hypothetical protein